MARVLTWEVDFGKGVPAHLKRRYVESEWGCWVRTKEQAIASHLDFRRMQVVAAKAKLEKAQAELAAAEYQLAKDEETLGVRR